MSRVECEVEEITLTNNDGKPVDSVQVTCNECGEMAESYGRSEKSIKRCMVMLNADCGKGNYYVAEE